MNRNSQSSQKQKRVMFEKTNSSVGNQPQDIEGLNKRLVQPLQLINRKDTQISLNKLNTLPLKEIQNIQRNGIQIPQKFEPQTTSIQESPCGLSELEKQLRKLENPRQSKTQDQQYIMQGDSQTQAYENQQNNQIKQDNHGSFNTKTPKQRYQQTLNESELSYTYQNPLYQKQQQQLSIKDIPICIQPNQNVQNTQSYQQYLSSIQNNQSKRYMERQTSQPQESLNNNLNKFRQSHGSQEDFIPDKNSYANKYQTELLRQKQQSDQIQFHENQKNYQQQRKQDCKAIEKLMELTDPSNQSTEQSIQSFCQEQQKDVDTNTLNNLPNCRNMEQATNIEQNMDLKPFQKQQNLQFIPYNLLNYSEKYRQGQNASKNNQNVRNHGKLDRINNLTDCGNQLNEIPDQDCPYNMSTLQIQGNAKEYPTTQQHNKRNHSESKNQNKNQQFQRSDLQNKILQNQNQQHKSQQRGQTIFKLQNSDKQNNCNENKIFIQKKHNQSNEANNKLQNVQSKQLEGCKDYGEINGNKQLFKDQQNQYQGNQYIMQEGYYSQFELQQKVKNLEYLLSKEQSQNQQLYQQIEQIKEEKAQLEQKWQDAKSIINQAHTTINKVFQTSRTSFTDLTNDN